MRLHRSLALLAPLALGAAALPLLQEEPALDRLPDPPPVVFAELSAHPSGLGAAVAAAEAAVGGRARHAEQDAASGVSEVYVYTDEECLLVRVGPDGAVLERRVQPEYTLPGAPVEGAPLVLNASGLMYYELEPGTGPSATQVTTRVQVHYTGWLVDGTKFDSSHDRGFPLVTPLNQVVPGWTEGVGTMKVGGKRKLIVPYPLGYGEEGSPPKIPARAMLIFDVELLGLVEG